MSPRGAGYLFGGDVVTQVGVLYFLFFIYLLFVYLFIYYYYLFLFLKLLHTINIINLLLCISSTRRMDWNWYAEHINWWWKDTYKCLTSLLWLFGRPLIIATGTLSPLLFFTGIKPVKLLILLAKKRTPKILTFFFSLFSLASSPFSFLSFYSSFPFHLDLGVVMLQQFWNWMNI